MFAPFESKNSLSGHLRGIRGIRDDTSWNLCFLFGRVCGWKALDKSKGGSKCENFYITQPCHSLFVKRLMLVSKAFLVFRVRDVPV